MGETFLAQGGKMEEQLTNILDMITDVERKNWPAKAAIPEIKKVVALLAEQARAAEQGQANEWKCFHCGEHFTSVGAAQDHFGATPEDQVACKIKVGEERGLVMSLRRAHKDREELWQIIDDIDTVSDAAKSDDAGYRRAVERMVQKRNAIAESPDGHKLNWKRDLLWDESARVIREQPAQPPAGDVLYAMAAMPTNEEWYEATTEHDARSDPDGKRFASAYGVHQMLINRRARLAKPEQTDERPQYTETLRPCIDPLVCSICGADVLNTQKHSEWHAALKAGKQ